MNIVHFLQVLKKMSDSLIPSFSKSDVSESFRSLMTKEQLWASCSGHSLKMSNHEWFAQITHKKCLTLSESLRLLTKNEQMTESLVFYWGNCSFACFSQKNHQFTQKTDEQISNPGWSSKMSAEIAQVSEAQPVSVPHYIMQVLKYMKIHTVSYFNY